MLEIHINTVLFKHNLLEIPKLYEIIKELEPKSWRITRPFNIGRWIKFRDDLRVSIEQELEIYESVVNNFVNLI